MTKALLSQFYPEDFLLLGALEFIEEKPLSSLYKNVNVFIISLRLEGESVRVCVAMHVAVGIADEC